MTDATLAQKIISAGAQVEAVEIQLEHFKKGFPFLTLLAPATPEKGIQVASPDQLAHYQELFEKRASELEIVKFVPASGAASRMFKDLFSFLEGDGDVNTNPFARNFFEQLQQFAFYEDLESHFQSKNQSLATLLDLKEYKKIVNALLSDEGLCYGNKPKGLLKFHVYPTENRTPAHEHLIEGLHYGVGKDKKVRLHFTVSPEHEKGFLDEINARVVDLEKESGFRFEVTYSQQKKSTDTLAVDADNLPFLEEDGSLLFRPAGHGALLENLNDLSADLIFIKNIDNVVPDRLKETTRDYKMALAGLLLEVQDRLFSALEALNAGISPETIAQAKKVYTEELGGTLPAAYEQAEPEVLASFLKSKLHRPLRVCGMVKNSGEPGGGPFWILEKDGSQSLQILETAQINTADAKSKKIMDSSTHFNPVDLVCATRDYEGLSFDLLAFRDIETGFITEKSKSGKVLKALELPGLWNGAMAYWNTLFVEVPLVTFNPVKTSNDLLREEHL